MNMKRSLTLLCSLVLLACVVITPVPPDLGTESDIPGTGAQEALAAFDNKTNGVVDQATFDEDQEAFNDVEVISDGLGPLFNAASCLFCHQNPVSGGGSQVVKLRLSAGAKAGVFGAAFDKALGQRLFEADEFYERIAPRSLGEDERRLHRQALAGMLWTKQYYHYDVDKWLKEHEAHPFSANARPGVRNAEWFHMFNGDIISMPDKWEYPWYAAWDLAFHTVALALVDFDFAKEQLLLMLRNRLD